VGPLLEDSLLLSLCASAYEGIALLFTECLLSFPFVPMLRICLSVVFCLSPLFLCTGVNRMLLIFSCPPVLYGRLSVGMTDCPGRHHCFSTFLPACLPALIFIIIFLPFPSVVRAPLKEGSRDSGGRDERKRGRGQPAGKGNEGTKNSRQTRTHRERGGG